MRFDLTAPKSYSLSKASKTLVKNLDQPLSVRVFFSDNLPSTYTSVSQYVKDILVEYKGAANKNFSVSFMDMSKPENEELARSLGIQLASNRFIWGLLLLMVTVWRLLIRFRPRMVLNSI